MSAIQSGANWWIDTVSRFSGGNIGTATRGAAAIALAASGNDTGDQADSFSSMLQEQQDNAMIPATGDMPAQTSPIDLTKDSGVSAEVVAATAMQVGLIQTAMREHQATGTIPFTNDQTEQSATDDQAAEKTLQISLLSQILQNPFAALAASNPGADRPGIYALLGPI